MAETDPVRIVVEIVDNFSDDLAELRGQLEELDMKDLDVDLDVEDDGDIESVKAQLNALREKMRAELDVDVDGFFQAWAKKQQLKRDMVSTLHIDSDGGGLDIAGDPEAFAGLQEATRTSLEDKIPAHPQSFGDMGARGTADALFDDSAAMDFTESVREATQAASDFESETDFRFGDFLGRERGSGQFRAMFGDGGPDGFFDVFGDVLGDRGAGGEMFGDRGRSRSRRAGRAVGKMADQFGNLGRKLLQYRPSIMDWWNILALLIPIMVTMIGLVVGLAAAFVALGAAAATIAGVGLLGWGDSMSESLSNLQAEARKLGETLFGVLQPAAEAFQPMQEDAMEAIPSMIADLVGPMQQLTVFGDELAGMGQGFIDWMVEGLNAAVALEDEIGQILTRFGAGFGNFLIGVLRNMVMEVYRNQNAYADLAGILLDSIVIIFNVVKAVAFTISQFRFLFDVLAMVSNFLSNEWAVMLLTTITIIVLLETVVASLVQTLAFLSAFGLSSWIASVFPYLTLFIDYVIAATIALWEMYGALATVLAATGVGLGLLAVGTAVGQAVGGSVNNPGGGQRGDFAQSGGNTFINVEGNVEKKQMDRLLDKVPGETRGEMGMQEGIEGPN